MKPTSVPTSVPTSLPNSASPVTAAADDGTDAAAATAREWLSALADGRADALQPGCEAWRRDPQARAAWHGWQLIGDVMRSDDLAQTATHDAAFLARLRERLADEPVPLAPAPLPSVAHAAAAASAAATSSARLGQPRRRHAWLAPAAVAAGFMAVAGALLVVQMSGAEDPGAAATLAEAQRSGSGLRLVGGVAPGASQQAPAPSPVMDSQFIRDAQIDRLLEAHRGAMGGAMVVPGGMKRHLDPVMPAAVTVTVPGAQPGSGAGSALAPLR